MDTITSLNKCANWEQFKFYHDEGQKYSVLLPEGGVLYLSSHTIFILRENKSVLLSSTATKLTTDANVFDFTKSEYSAEEIIQFFYLLTFPYDDVGGVEDITQAIMLSHLYVPKIAELLAGMLYYPSVVMSTDIENFRYFWKIIKIKQLTNTIGTLHRASTVFNFLRCIPHSLYLLDNTVDVRQLVDDVNNRLRNDDIIHEICKMWENKDVDRLSGHEIKVRGLVQTNDQGITCLRIPVVAEHLGLPKPTLDELLVIGKIAARFYSNNNNDRQKRINWNVDGKVIQINHYELIHYQLLVEAIRNYDDPKENYYQLGDDECM